MCFKKCFTKLIQPNPIRKIPCKLQRETELPNLQSYCALKCKLHLFDLLLICCACCLLTDSLYICTKRNRTQTRWSICIFVSQTNLIGFDLIWTDGQTEPMSNSFGRLCYLWWLATAWGDWQARRRGRDLRGWRRSDRRRTLRCSPWPSVAPPPGRAARSYRARCCRLCSGTLPVTSRTNQSINQSNKLVPGQPSNAGVNEIRQKINTNWD